MALARLAKLDQTNPFVQAQCHQLAHQLGHAGFAHYGSVTKATAQGSEICWSGYYHGVVEAYISRWTDARLRTEMPRICKQTPGHPYSLAYYNCWHGLGHGLTIRFDNDVFKALPYCDAIRRDWEQQSCYSGVFMQNIVVDGVMHHSVDLKRSDPVYPCDAVAVRQKSSCYLMVTSYVLKVKGYDYAATFKVCDHVEKAFVTTCYQSLGRDISGNSLLDPAKVHDAVRPRRGARPRLVRGRRGQERGLRAARAVAGRRALPALPRHAPHGLRAGAQRGRLDALR